MMCKVINLVLFCAALLPSLIQSDPATEALLQAFLTRLNQMASQNEDIPNIFRPSRYLGKGAFGLTYNGTLIPIDKRVAMKFTMLSHEEKAKKEYKMYTYLHAIDNEQVEMYGVPAIYYYGKWDAYVMMAMTLFDTTVKSKVGNVYELDALIIFREFVKASKYIHSCGIRHDDIKLDNIMFRRNKGFIIDYNLANKMNRINFGGTLKYLPMSGHTTGLRCARDDWESFLYSMCRLIGIELDWFHNRAFRQLSKNAKWDAVSVLKENVSSTMQKIQMITNDGLRRVFLEFSNHVFTDVKIPPYDAVYDMINREIRTLYPHLPAIVSWIEEEHRTQVMLDSNSIFDITTMDGPVRGRLPSYPVAKFHYFRNLYRATTNPGSQTQTGQASGSR